MSLAFPFGLPPGLIEPTESDDLVSFADLWAREIENELLVFDALEHWWPRHIKFPKN